MVDKNKEENQANDAQNQSQKAKEKAFTCTNTIRLCISSHFPAGYTHAVIILSSVSANVTKNVQQLLRYIDFLHFLAIFIASISFDFSLNQTFDKKGLCPKTC